MLSQGEIIEIIKTRPGKEWTTKEIKAKLPELSNNTIKANVSRLIFHKEIKARIGKQNKFYFKYIEDEGE